MKLKSNLFHIKLRLVLKHTGMTQKQLAKSIGCTSGAVSQWLSDDPQKRTTPEMHHILAVADVTGFWVGWFVEDQRPANVESPDAKPEIVRAYQNLISRERTT